MSSARYLSRDGEGAAEGERDLRVRRDARGRVRRARRDRTRGVDPNAEDKTPKNWTKRLARGGKKKAKADEGAEDAKADAKPEAKKK